MSDAIELFYYIFNQVVYFVFTQASIAPAVTIGWICLTVFVFTILIRSLLNLPSGIYYGSHGKGSNRSTGFYRKD